MRLANVAAVVCLALLATAACSADSGWNDDDDSEAQTDKGAADDDRNARTSGTNTGGTVGTVVDNNLDGSGAVPVQDTATGGDTTLPTSNGGPPAADVSETGGTFTIPGAGGNVFMSGGTGTTSTGGSTPGSSGGSGPSFGAGGSTSGGNTFGGNTFGGAPTGTTAPVTGG